MSILGDYIKIKHGYAFKGTGISTEDNGVVLVTPGNFAIGGGFKEDKCKFFTEDYPEEYRLSEDDLIVTMTDLSKDMDTLGYSALVPASDRIYLHNQRIGLVELIRDDVDKHFIHWFMRTYKYQRTIAGSASGTTVHHTSPGRICDVEVAFPSYEMQKKIAFVLDSIEGKIKLNEEVNNNLAEMLQSVYQQWFSVSESKTECGVLSDICQYSKERIAVSSLSLNSYYSTENMIPGKAGAFAASSLPTVVQTTRAKVGDVLISNIRPYFKKIVYCHTDCGCSTDVLCFTPKIPRLSAYLYSTLYADRFFDFMVAGSKGTKMPRGDKLQIMAYPVHIPSEEELETFNRLAQPILTQIEQNRLENISLLSLRDGLLPRLMSGEIDVSNIDL